MDEIKQLEKERDKARDAYLAVEVKHPRDLIKRGKRLRELDMANARLKRAQKEEQ